MRHYAESFYSLDTDQVRRPTSSRRRTKYSARPKSSGRQSGWEVFLSPRVDANALRYIFRSSPTRPSGPNPPRRSLFQATANPPRTYRQPQMSKSTIGRMELFLGWVARILLLLTAVGITTFVGYYVRVVSFGEPISEPSADTTSQGIGKSGRRYLTHPGPDAVPADTASPPIDTTGSND